MVPISLSNNIKTEAEGAFKGIQCSIKVVKEVYSCLEKFESWLTAIIKAMGKQIAQISD